MASETALGLLECLDQAVDDSAYVTAAAAKRQVVAYAYGCVQFTPATAGLRIGTVGTQLMSFWGATRIAQPTALTAQLTTVTFSAPGTPDYAIAVTQTTPFGTSTADEFNTLLSVVANLQARVGELETKFKTTTGIGLLAG